MASIASKIITSSRLSPLSRPSKAFFEIFININSIGIITGKLNTAINVALFSAFDAIPAIIVSVLANPIAPKMSAIKYKPTSPTGLPITRAYTPKPTNDNTSMSIEL
ncbi:granzyme C-like protein [Corchorus olitorius]|uniref:Granzyme C-like protein n=1 Tax=Corchorus olitorius TaxID=93759 RepID=A0A1R3L2R2_9ROSI|nr:granzyme C-like protein [Corchorus olitorius]